MYCAGVYASFSRVVKVPICMTLPDDLCLFITEHPNHFSYVHA